MGEADVAERGRGQEDGLRVRPWEAATVGKCNALSGTAGVHWDVELGALYTDVNTEAQLCFGVC